jgi:hypothetical protein
MTEQYKHYCRRTFDIDVLLFIDDIFNVDKKSLDSFIDRNMDLSNNLSEDEFLDFCCLDLADMYSFKF